MPSFSSSLLEAICRSIDGSDDHHHRVKTSGSSGRSNNAAQVDEERDMESLRRAIMVEKWMESYATGIAPSHFPISDTSTDHSSTFSSSASKLHLLFPTQKPKNSQTTETNGSSNKNHVVETTAERMGRFTWTKSGKLTKNIHGGLKKMKEPNSPSSRVVNFWNSIFGQRSMKWNKSMEEWCSVRKSRSMNDTAAMALASRSCLSKTSSSKSDKLTRSVRFSPFPAIVDQDCRPYCKSIVNDIKKKGSCSHRIQIICSEEKGCREDVVESEEFYESESDDVDGRSCASSDLFELDHSIGRVGLYTHKEEEDEELPVYGTTVFQMN